METGFRVRVTWVVIRVVPPPPLSEPAELFGEQGRLPGHLQLWRPLCRAGLLSGHPPFTNIPPSALCPLVPGCARCSGCS